MIMCLIHSATVVLFCVHLVPHKQKNIDGRCFTQNCCSATLTSSLDIILFLDHWFCLYVFLEIRVVFCNAFRCNRTFIFYLKNNCKLRTAGKQVLQPLLTKMLCLRYRSLARVIPNPSKPFLNVPAWVSFKCSYSICLNYFFWPFVPSTQHSSERKGCPTGSY